ncbi:Baculoviral IAP repeat-containing protein 6 [Globodera pallida]|nr:Baculoviral IAP repeat-containing protein 6 [Globodera pallida]
MNEVTAMTFDLPSPDKRIELFRLDAEPVMKYVTPGFGMFISRFTDDMLVSYFKNKEIDKYQKNVPSHLRYFYLIRAVWKKVILDEQRAEWEKRAEDEPHLSQLTENSPDLFDRILRREIDTKLYERSEAFAEFKARENAFKEFFMQKYNRNLEVPSDSPFERTVNLLINVDYSESITSPHSIQLLKVFLNLEQFVNVLIESDKGKAVELLKQTVNYNPQQKEYLLPMLNKLLPTSSCEDLDQIATMIRTSSQSVKTNLDKLNYRQLAFYPLLILEKLLCRFSPDRVGAQKASEFRHQALKLGVMDFVLECISHFTHQRSNFKKTRSWRMPLPQYSVSFSMENLVLKRPNNQNQAEPSKECAYKDKIRFAKGTGYGSGDTRQVWDYKETEQKIRYDDDNIACLLNILRAFIMPPIHEQDSTLSERSSGDKGTSKRCQNNRRKNSDQKKASTKSMDALVNRNCIPMEEEFLKLLQRSSLRLVIRSYLMSDTLLEVHKNIASYHAVFQLLVALSKSLPINTNVVSLFANFYDDNLALEEVDTDDEGLLFDGRAKAEEKQEILPFDVIFCTEEGGGFKVERNALIELLKHFSTNIDNYLKRIGSTITSQPSQVQNGYFDLFSFFGFGSGRNESGEKEVAGREEEKQLQELSSICKNVTSIFHELNKSKIGSISGEILKKLRVRDSSSSECLDGTAGTSASTDNEAEKYCTAMQDLKFAVITFEKIFKKDAYFYRTKIKKEQTSGAANTTSRRIAREIQSLQSNLMLTKSTSAFVRSCEEHLDAMKVLITGPEGTPYQNGCFEFDFFFPSNFPHSAPQVHLRTTGNNSVRFNPNLYNDGKVCLSILGTWPGRPEEQWNAERSSLLQVIISIQSLILVNDPYFNEPGYERYNNTQQGDLASQRYNAVIQVATVRWAILEQLKRPPIELESVVQLHFWLKRDEISDQIKGWIKEWKKRGKQDNRFSATADELEKLLKQVNDEFQKLKKLNLKE